MRCFRGVPVLAAVAAVALLALLPAAPAAAHTDRPADAVEGNGSVPAYRSTGRTLLVCPSTKADFDNRVVAFPDDVRAANEQLYTQCQAGGFHSVQEAVNNAKDPGTTIKILPGIYLEEPSLAPQPNCTQPATSVLSFDDQVRCPHVQNLIAILNRPGLQLEGTGAKPDDVVIDVQFGKLNGIRADRSPGVYLRNFTVQHATSNAVYVLESDGFAIDTVLGRWNGENGFLTRAVDHGLYSGCSAYGNGDAGIAVESSADINAGQEHAVNRYAVEVKGCRADHNLLGFSGPSANSVWAHDNVFTDNTAGVLLGSATPTVSGKPQNHALFEKNVIATNNSDYYRYVRDGTCQKPYAERGIENGTVCPAAGVPVGTGAITTGGNYDSWRGNWVYDNSYAGFVATWVPGFVRENNGLRAQVDTSHHDEYDQNSMGITKEGEHAPNGMDYWWDGQGVGSCWQRPSTDGADPMVLPLCGGLSSHRYLAEPWKVVKLTVCSNYDLVSQRIPSDCDWFGAHGLARIEVKYALGEAAVLGLVILLLWWRLLGGSGLGSTGAVAALAGLAAEVYGTVKEATPFAPLGLGLLGIGLMCVGIALRRRGRSGLGWLTVGVAVFALLGAIDRGLYALPWIPVPPSIIRIVLELYWIPSALVAASRGRMLAITGPPRERRGGRPRKPSRKGPSDPLERFAATLRD
jgi:hypothetical protein